jgi:hypothetical protein
MRSQSGYLYLLALFLADCLCLTPFLSLSFFLSFSLSFSLSLPFYLFLSLSRMYKDQSKKVRDMEVQRKRLEGDLLNRSLKVRLTPYVHGNSTTACFVHKVLFRPVLFFMAFSSPLLFSSILPSCLFSRP